MSYHAALWYLVVFIDNLQLHSVQFQDSLQTCLWIGSYHFLRHLVSVKKARGELSSSE